ncbi:hypothetical protein GQ53DRAFT_179664 [Thozetella sp. PMI_491]|nr:hypothetical protein GQ53DRAFT_179664 [Thozetella sp. PMI_491]
MKSAILGLAVLGFALDGADANLLRAGPQDPARRWAAQKTGDLLLLGDNAMSPAPTPAPGAAVPELLFAKRQASTTVCGYELGIYTASLTCGKGWTCTYNPTWLVGGCCDPNGDGTCPLITKCLDSTQSSLYTLTNSYTAYCGQSSAPFCATITYADFKGYSAFLCSAKKTVEAAYVNPTSIPSSSTPTTTTQPPTTTSSSSTSTSFSSTSTSTTPSPTPAPDSGSSTPVGAIAGGVVGGVAVLALVAFGIWWIMRKSKKDKAANAPPAPAPAPAPGPAPMGAYSPAPGYDGQHMQMAQQQQPYPQQHHYPPQGAPIYNPAQDPRASIAKPYDGSYTSGYGSNPSSPPPPHTPGSPSPPYQFPTELSTDRPDREVRELA